MSDYNQNSREEVAKREIGITQISRFWAYFLGVLFFLFIFSYPLIQMGYEYRVLQEKIPQPLDIFYPYKTTTWKKLLTANNRFMDYIHNYYDKNLNNKSLLRKYLVPPMKVRFFRIFKTLGENATVGEDHWLFYKGDLEYLTGRGIIHPGLKINLLENIKPRNSNPIDAFSDFNQYLGKIGVKLIVLPMPVKSSFYPEKYSSLMAGVPIPVQNIGYNDFIDLLSKKGITVYDPGTLFTKSIQKGIPVYLNYDTHWSPDGVVLLAQELSKFIKQQVYFPSSNTTLFTASFVPIDMISDLVYNSKLNYKKKILPLEKINIRMIYKNGLPVPQESSADILLMGDSFLNVYSNITEWSGYSGGFRENLAYELQRPVESIAFNGASAYKMQQILENKIKQDENYLKNKKIVIWEIIEHQLYKGDWHEVDFDKISSLSRDTTVDIKSSDNR